MPPRLLLMTREISPCDGGGRGVEGPAVMFRLWLSRYFEFASSAAATAGGAAAGGVVEGGAATGAPRPCDPCPWLRRLLLGAGSGARAAGAMGAGTGAAAAAGARLGFSTTAASGSVVAALAGGGGVTGLGFFIIVNISTATLK